ncbi:MAG: hypothetical protein MJ252_03070 [archaeon]|nr:hypothetical protein [archaeon]
MNYTTQQDKGKGKTNEFIEASRALVDTKTSLIVHQILQLKEANERLIAKCKIK